LMAVHRPGPRLEGAPAMSVRRGHRPRCSSHTSKPGPLTGFPLRHLANSIVASSSEILSELAPWATEISVDTQQFSETAWYGAPEGASRELAKRRAEALTFRNLIFSGNSRGLPPSAAALVQSCNSSYNVVDLNWRGDEYEGLCFPAEEFFPLGPRQ